MDSGTFENDNRPFPLHRTIRSAMDPIMIVSAAKGITVECQLDHRVDGVAPQQGTDGLWVRLFTDTLERLLRLVLSFLGNR